jgi:hypothetical protein
LVIGVKPRVIFVHGVPAQDELRKRGIDVNIRTPINDQNSTLEIPGAVFKTRVFGYSHLSGIPLSGFYPDPGDLPKLAARIITQK